MSLISAVLFVGMLAFAINALADQNSSPRHLFGRDPDFLVDESCTGDNLAILNQAIPDATTLADAAFTLVSALFGTSEQRAAVNAQTPQVEALLVALFDPQFESDSDDDDGSYEGDDESADGVTVGDTETLPTVNQDHLNPGDAFQIKKAFDVEDTWIGPTKVYCGEDFVKQSEFASIAKCDRETNAPFAYSLGPDGPDFPDRTIVLCQLVFDSFPKSIAELSTPNVGDSLRNFFTLGGTLVHEQMHLQDISRGDPASKFVDCVGLTQTKSLGFPPHANAQSYAWFVTAVIPLTIGFDWVTGFAMNVAVVNATQ
ncbi:hypothetical protein LTR17_010490 [Elasticomyces elasticus]|nr:hypothetical protein LTR17_010490 [Elasticomyces elasticus]